MQITAGRVHRVTTGSEVNFKDVEHPEPLHASERRIIEILRDNDNRLEGFEIPQEVVERMISDGSRWLTLGKADGPSGLGGIVITEDRIVSADGNRFSALGYAKNGVFTELEVLEWFSPDSLPKDFKSLDPAKLSLEPRSEYPGKTSS